MFNLRRAVFGIALIGAALPASAQGAPSPAPAQPEAYLSCRILAGTDQEAFKFAGAATIWNDSDLDGLNTIPGGDLVYRCSREIRSNVCGMMSGEMINSEAVKEDSMTGAVIGAMSQDMGIIGGATAGAGVSIASSVFGKTSKLASCGQQFEAVNLISPNVSVDWSGTFADQSQLNYTNFLLVIDYARQSDLITQEDVNQVISFTDQVLTVLTQ